MSYFEAEMRQIRYSAPPDPLAGFRGLLLRGRMGGEGVGDREERKGEGKRRWRGST